MNSEGALSLKRHHIAIASLLALFLWACDFNPGADRSGCNGYPEFIRTPPDTSIALNAGPLIIEVEGDEPIARHTGGHGFHFSGGSGDREIATAYITGYEGRNVLLVTPVSPGVTAIGIGVEDFCDKTDNTHFTLTVTAAE